MNSELESVPLETLEEEIGELAAHIHAATCRWLLLVAEFDRREGWLEWGAKSCSRAAGLESTAETPVARSACERLDYDIAIEGVLAAEGLLSSGCVTPWHYRASHGVAAEREPGGSAEPMPSESQLLT